MDREELRAGARAVAPMLIGIIPFGLVAGAAPAAAGFDVVAAVGMSGIVFAGASQLALVDVLDGGGTALVAALAAWTINLRILLYSASLAPYLAEVSLPRRLLTSYLLVDQNYAVAIARWSDRRHRPDESFIVGGGLMLGSAWLVCTAIGALAGNSLPDDLPLDFAVPLVFLVLLVPVLSTKPAIASGLCGGVAAVLAAEAGAGPLSIMVGAAVGIAAGTVTDLVVGGATPTAEAH